MQPPQALVHSEPIVLMTVDSLINSDGSVDSWGQIYFPAGVILQSFCHTLASPFSSLFQMLDVIVAKIIIIIIIISTANILLVPTAYTHRFLFELLYYIHFPY